MCLLLPELRGFSATMTARLLSLNSSMGNANRNQAPLGAECSRRENEIVASFPLNLVLDLRRDLKCHPSPAVSVSSASPKISRSVIAAIVSLQVLFRVRYRVRPLVRPVVIPFPLSQVAFRRRKPLWVLRRWDITLPAT